MNLFSLHLSVDADWEAVEAQLLELSAIPGVTVVLYDGTIVGAPEAAPLIAGVDYIPADVAE